MTTALLLTDEPVANGHLWWACRLARLRGESLLLIDAAANPASDRGRVREYLTKTLRDDAPVDGTDAKDPESVEPLLATENVAGGDVTEKVVRVVEERQVALLIVTRAAGVRGESPDFAFRLEVLNRTACPTVQLRLSETTPMQFTRIGVPLGRDDFSRPAVEFALSLRPDMQTPLYLIRVEPDFDTVAASAIRRSIRRFIKRHVRYPDLEIRPKAVLGESIAEGVLQAAEEESLDLLVVGVGEFTTRHFRPKTSTSEMLLRRAADQTLLIVYPPATAHGRLLRAVDRWKRRHVPQLNREGRVRLVDGIRESSQWDFDFIALTGLAALIATMGLEIGSVVVVIGAMLVAPMMMPIMGLGLAVVQTNARMTQDCLRTVLRGFLLALAVSTVVGLLFNLSSFVTQTPVGISGMVDERSAFTPVDIAVALVSGLVAAYARGRENLWSALPGVAIATSLVPPICAAGIFAASLQPLSALGALSLFTANLTAIVMGAALAFWLVGLRGPRETAEWPAWASVALILFAMFLLGLLAWSLQPGGSGEVTLGLLGAGSVAG